MIKIELSKEKRKEIEDLHWKWFEKSYKKNYANIKKSLGLVSDDEIKEIIIGKKTVLEKYRLKIGKKKDKALERKFGYDTFSKGSAEWGAYQLCEKLGVDVCPYCNRQYIFTVTGRKRKIARPEMDHFYNKSDYPYLSCSLYNLIPSCHICNHVKSDNIDEIIYPYEEAFGNDAEFCIRYKQNIDLKNLLDVKNIEIFFKNMFAQRKSCNFKRCKRIMNSIAVFHLEDIYNYHQLELNDLLKRYKNYSKQKVSDILKMIVKASGNSSENDIEMILRLYSKQIKEMILGIIPLGAGYRQYPLRKFKEDIIALLDNAN
ncbi:MAG: hypothetical protein HDR35_11215 [Treponema sp.]|nr:hypothetical protein [Treponema sp.]